MIEKLNSLNIRFEVINKTLNQITNEIEYTLSNGMVIPNTDENIVYIPIKDMIYIFGVDFINKEFPMYYRDYKINNLIDG